MEQGIIGRLVQMKPQVIEPFLMDDGLRMGEHYKVLGIVASMLLLEVGKNLVEVYPRRVELV